MPTTPLCLREAPLPACDTDTLSAMLPSAPLLASPEGKWPGIALRHYRHPASGTPEIRHRDHLLVVHRSAGASLEEHSDGGIRHAATAPGRVSLSPADCPVSRHWDGPSDVLLILVGKALVDSAARDLGVDPSRLRLLPRLATPDNDLDRLGHLLLSQAEGPQRGTPLMVDTLARALALHLVTHHSNVDHRLSRALPSLPPRHVARVIDYMREHLGEPLSVPDLGALAGMSPSHLTRAFRGALHTTPHAYLLRLRLEKACEMLAGTDCSITQIAFRCGFEQSQHFAATFRRRIGVSPSAWRRAC